MIKASGKPIRKCGKCAANWGFGDVVTDRLSTAPVLAKPPKKVKFFTGPLLTDPCWRKGQKKHINFSTQTSLPPALSNTPLWGSQNELMCLTSRRIMLKVATSTFSGDVWGERNEDPNKPHFCQTGHKKFACSCPYHRTHTHRCHLRKLIRTFAMQVRISLGIP